MAYKTNWLSGILCPMLIAFSATPVSALEAKMSGGYWHSLFINNGNVYGMGQNGQGELTAGPEAEFKTPIFTGFKNAKSVAGSPFRSAILTHDGKVYFSGRKALTSAIAANRKKGITLEAAKAAQARYELPATSAPVTDMALTNTDFYYVVAGNVFKWNFVVAPVQLTTSGNAKTIAAGDSHLVILDKNGSVSVYGKNDQGQLGLGTRVDAATVTPLQVPPVESIAAGSARTFLITKPGKVLGFGLNNRGELGTGDEVARLSPVEIVGLQGVKKMLTGITHTGAVLENGSFAATGWHNYIVQTATTYLYNVNTRFVVIPGVEAVADAAIPGDHTLVDQGQSGLVRGWGGNNNGKLGDGTNTERHWLTNAYFTQLPSSLVSEDPVCTAARIGNPFAAIDVAVAYRCSIPIYGSMNECLKANPTVSQPGEFCKNLIVPADRGNVKN